MCRDGQGFDLADTIEKDEEFGRAGSGHGEGEGSFPQLRLVGLGECGTHALVSVKMGASATVRAKFGFCRMMPRWALVQLALRGLMAST